VYKPCGPKVFLGFLALGFGLLLHGSANPPLSCSWGQTMPQPPLTLLPLPSVDRQVQSVASVSSPGAASRGFLDALDFHPPMEGNYHAGSGTPTTQAHEEPCRGASRPRCDPTERMADTALR
jgi:hypothetical protein